MTWRIVVITQRAKLDLRLNTMVVRGATITKIHLGEISTVLVENTEVSFTASLLCELMKRKIKVIFCDEKRNPCCETISYYGSHDTSIKLREQLQWRQEVKDAVWTEIVAEKIRQQSQVLKDGGHSESALLLRYLQELEPRDATNREGHAAKVYFNALFGLNFTRSADNIVNAALNYGYSILLSAFNREIVANGYLTQLGLFHDNMFNYFNLGCDFMEPFRPLVDRVVLNLTGEQFEQAEKIVMVGVLNQEVIIDGKSHYVNNAIKIYCKSIFEALGNQDVAQLKFYRNEL
ncbi:MAG: type II CRISPR-associated endonuclease Cas1 [Acidaminococcaceae bacterium]